MGRVFSINGEEVLVDPNWHISDALNSRSSMELTAIEMTSVPELGQEIIVYKHLESGESARDIGDATFSRTSNATMQDGSSVTANVTRYETGVYGNAITIEEGTTNHITAQSSFTVYTGASATSTLETTGEWAGWYKAEITRVGGGGFIAYLQTKSQPVDETRTYSIEWHNASANVLPYLAGLTVNVGYLSNTSGNKWATTYKNIGGTAINETIYLRHLTLANTNVSETVYYRYYQNETKGYPTTFIDGTRSPETLTIPAPEESAGTIQCRIKPLRSPGTIEQYIFDAGGLGLKNMEAYVNTDGTLGVRYSSPGINIVLNGDFSKGSTSWGGSKCTYAMANNQCLFTATEQYGVVIQTIVNYANYKSHKLYFAALIKVADSNEVFYLNDGTTQVGGSTPAVYGAFSSTSNVMTISSAATTLVIRLQDNRAAGWTEIGLKNIMCIDLTSLFGAGNEPSKATCDTLFATWFDYVTPIVLKGSTILAKNIWYTVAWKWSSSGVKLLLNGVEEDSSIIPPEMVLLDEDKTVNNDVENGNFVDGSNWTPNGSTESVANNTYSDTGNGSSSAPYFEQDTGVTYIGTNLVYLSVLARVTNTSCTKIQIQVRGSSSGVSTYDLNTPTQNEWYRISNIFTIDYTFSGHLIVRIIHTYTDAATANGKVMECREVLDVDLTTTFGRYDEPVTRWCDAYFNNWFDSMTLSSKVNFGRNLSVTNIVTNGDFTDTSGWNAYASTLSAASNTLSVTGDGSGEVAATNQSTGSAIGITDYYNTVFLVRVTNASCTKIYIQYDGSTGGTNKDVWTQLNPIQNTWYSVSIKDTPPADATGNFRFTINHAYADAATQNGKVMEIKSVVIVNATDDFGSSFEPSTAWSTANLLPWFDGTTTLYERLDGLLDDVRISNIAREDKDILDTYNYGAASPIDEYTTAKIPFDDTLDIYARPKIFAGTIDTVEANEPFPGVLYNHITAVDFNQLADKRVINQSYTSATTSDIVYNIISAVLTEEGVTAGTIETGPILTEVHFNYISCSEALNYLKTATGMNWNIDFEKRLNFTSSTLTLAPWTLNDSVQHEKFAVKKTRDQYRNRQYIRLGTGKVLGIQSEAPTPAPDGLSKTFILKYPIAKQPTININGTALATSDVGVLNVDSGKKWYFQYSSPNITQDDSEATLSAADTITVDYTGKRPVIVSTDNEAEIYNREQAETGTSGIYENVQTEQTINDNDQGTEYSEGLILKYGEIAVVATFETEVPGLRIGQVLPIQKSLYGITSDFLIESVDLNTIDWQKVHYSVKAIAGAALGGWEKMFQDLVRKSKGYTISENELLIILNTQTEKETWGGTTTVTIQDKYGNSWKKIGQLGSETDIKSLVSLGSGVALAGTSPTGKIYKTSDYGDTWTMITQLSAETTVMCFQNMGSGLVLAGTSPTGEIFFSSNSGNTWSLVTRLGSTTAVYAMAHAGSYVVAVAGNQIYQSTNSGGTWNLKYTASGTVSAVCFDTAGVFLAGTTSGNVYKSLDGGATWSYVTNIGVEIYCLESLNGGIELAGTTGFGVSGVYKSINYGSNWAHINYSGVYAIEKLSNNEVLLSENGEIAKSTNSGTSWSIINGSQSIMGHIAWSICDLGNGKVLCGVERVGKVYKSPSNGVGVTLYD